MVKKISQLSVVDSDTAEKARLEAEKARLEKEVEDTKLTRDEIRERVRTIRDELQATKQQYDAAVFDVVGIEMPRSLDRARNRRDPYLMVEDLNPLMDLYYRRCEAVLDDALESEFGNLKWVGQETAFQIGIFAGFIFSGASEAEIDRLEKALVLATAARHWELAKAKD